MSFESDNKYNITIWQGSTFGLTITVNDASGAASNLTNYSASMQIRPSYDSGAIKESLNTSNGEITIDGANGNLILQLAATRTANIPVNMLNGRPPKTIYVYDLEISSSSNVVSKILYGDAVVYGEVTR
jgi:hypothetical protein